MPLGVRFTSPSFAGAAPFINNTHIYNFLQCGSVETLLEYLQKNGLHQECTWNAIHTNFVECLSETHIIAAQNNDTVVIEDGSHDSGITCLGGAQFCTYFFITRDNHFIVECEMGSQQGLGKKKQ